MSRYGRFQLGERIFHGEVVGEEVAELEGDPVLCPARPMGRHPLHGLKILPPVTPSKVIAIGLNYADHAAEFNNPIPTEPLYFLKSPGSFLEHGGTVRVPHPEHRTDFEAELALVIGRRACKIAPGEAAACIFGYTCAQDISDRHIQKSDRQWIRAKSFDTFTPVGPFVRTDLDPSDLGIRMLQNGEIRQDSRTRQMVFSPSVLVHFLSHQLTLLPGDLVLTGTPAKVGPLRAGDELEVRIDGLDPLRNRVVND